MRRRKQGQVASEGRARRGTPGALTNGRRAPNFGSTGAPCDELQPVGPGTAKLTPLGPQIRDRGDTQSRGEDGGGIGIRKVIECLLRKQREA